MKTTLAILALMTISNLGMAQEKDQSIEKIGKVEIIQKALNSIPSSLLPYDLQKNCKEYMELLKSKQIESNELKALLEQAQMEWDKQGHIEDEEIKTMFQKLGKGQAKLDVIMESPEFKKLMTDRETAQMPLSSKDPVKVVTEFVEFRDKTLETANQILGLNLDLEDLYLQDGKLIGKFSKNQVDYVFRYEPGKSFTVKTMKEMPYQYNKGTDRYTHRIFKLRPDGEFGLAGYHKYVLGPFISHPWKIESFRVVEGHKSKLKKIEAKMSQCEIHPLFAAELESGDRNAKPSHGRAPAVELVEKVSDR